MAYTYDRTAAGETFYRRYQNMVDGFLKEVAAYAAELLMDEGVTVRKTGGNFVEGISSSGDPIQFTIMVKGLMAEGTLSRRNNSKRVKVDDLMSHDPRGVASQVISKSGLF